MSHDPSNADADLSETARAWIVRLASGEISPDEIEAYRRWVAEPAHRRVFEHERALWRSLGAIGSQIAPPASEPLSKPGPARRRIWGAGAALAACLVGLVAFAGAGDIHILLTADHRASHVVQRVMLPDGSQAMLDAEAAIDVDFDRIERRVTLLRGRAWFEVANARLPFRVDAGGALVEDIGTAFEVVRGASGGQAAVTEGRVRVAGGDQPHRWLTIRAGQGVSWQGAGDVSRDRDLAVSRIAAWREGDILLDRVPVRRAIDEIARYRDGRTFVVGNLDAHAPLTAILRTDRADEALETIASVANLSITHLPGGLRIVRPAS